MNTTEHLVEVYYRQLGCFTATDIKVEKGNNRQFDVLAYNLKSGLFYHIEVSVAHGVKFKAPTLDSIKEAIRFKFFGEPTNTRPDIENTDYKRGKKYLEPIKATYSKFGIDYGTLKRVWCTWSTDKFESTDLQNWKQSLANEFDLNEDNFEILSFRDEVIPALLRNIGTANYDDELLRTLSLISVYSEQTKSKISR